MHDRGSLCFILYTRCGIEAKVAHARPLKSTRHASLQSLGPPHSLVSMTVSVRVTYVDTIWKRRDGRNHTLSVSTHEHETTWTTRAVR